jgi:hypothetical protein
LRFNIVILSEGYTSNQLAAFHADATNAVNELLSTAPYPPYQKFFNAFAISVASAESGSDHPSRNEFHNTYFNSSFDSYGITRLITIPPNNFDSSSAHGSEKVDALLQEFTPEYDLVIMLVNDPDYGGSGGSSQSAGLPVLASRNVEAAELIRHETSHSFAGLGDEYDSPYPGFPDVEEPNTTQNTNRASLKWRAWVESTTPLPTPQTSVYDSVIGLFQGAHYHTTGWYRPKENCRMRALGVPFCEVCEETIVQSIYRCLKSGTHPLVESTSPPTAAVTGISGDSITFSATLLSPIAEPLAIQWFTNSTAVAGATNANFTLDPAQLPPGSSRVELQVRDLNPAVRTDPNQFLTSDASWTVTVEPASLSLSNVRSPVPGKVAFHVSGNGTGAAAIQASFDLHVWQSLVTNALTVAGFDFTNAPSPLIPFVGFRAVSLP